MGISVQSVRINNGETISYRKAGEGEVTLLLIHGNMSSSQHWEPLLKALPPGFTAYAIDLRGCGDSSYQQPVNSLADFAEDIADFTRELNLDKFIPIGWSTGGGVAMLLAAEYPRLVDKLVLLETVSYQGYPIYRKNEKGEPIAGEFYASKEEMAADPVQVAPVQAAYEAGNSDLLRYLWDELIYTANKPGPEDYEKNIAATMKQRNLVDLDWALAAFNIGHKFNGVTQGNGLVDKISCPVIAFWGDSDLVVTRAMVEETVEAIGDSARLVILENCGHSPVTDSLEEILQEINEFVG